MDKSFKRIKKYFGVSILNAMIGVIASAVLTRSFEKNVYGKISFFSSAVTVMFSLSCMGMDSAFMRFYYIPPNKDSKKVLFEKNIFVVSIFFCVYSTILFIFRTSFLNLFDETSLVFIFAFLLSTLSQIIFRYANLYFRMEEKINYYALQNLSSQICSKILIVLGVIISRDFVVIISLNSMLVFVVAIFWIYKIKTNFKQVKNKFTWTLKGYGDYIKYAFIAFPNDLIFYMNTYISQYIIKKNLSIEMVGAYSALSIFISAIAVFKLGFNNFWNPFMYKNYKTRQKTIVNCHSFVILVATFAEITILVCSDLIFMVLGESYRTNQEILGFLILGQTLLLIQETTAYGTLLAMKNNINLYYNLIYVSCRIILCMLLSKKYGILGVAIADAVSSLLLFIISTFFGQHYYKSIDNIRITMLSIVWICLIPVIYYFLNNSKLILIAIYGLILLIILFLNRKSLEELIYDINIKKKSNV